ncbi:hypothetical protein P7H33_09295 [Vagococcus lutrae]|uniref:hypothetical protein n=1 Tax=Vagococcus lutrae TaxID=81947 RepID=UPI0020976EF5|nr:hypothetical protein [Vagococcus lutrae]MCO7151876.1 hypothetical protein [Vagococcus lutrae]MDT2813137.1 hypothetical protein [Vagococcus lutrae]
MKIAEEIPKRTTWSHLGSTALYLIATLPEEQEQEVFSKMTTLSHIKETTLDFIGRL